MLYNIISLSFLIVNGFLQMENGLVLKYIEGWNKNKGTNKITLSLFTYDFHTLKTKPT